MLLLRDDRAWYSPSLSSLSASRSAAVGALAVERFGSLPAKLDAQVILLAAGFSIATGLFFGYYPARKASQLDPIEALRSQ
jgi:ABC-type antimicrobial peptide transport system permease subunit